MLIKEFRITMPLTVEEYQMGQLFATSELSKNETGGGEGIEVLKNEPFTNHPLLGNRYSSGQYSHKIYHIASKVPAFIRLLIPKGSMAFHEESWNAYPYTRTVISNPGYMKERFLLTIDSFHAPDRGHQENVHELDDDRLRLREVVRIDIAHDPVDSGDYKADEDPTKFHSTKANRGPLTSPTWQATTKPAMTCYKLVTVEFEWFGLQARVESYILKCERRLFTIFHREMFCWMDRWVDLTMEDMREIEERTKSELDRVRMVGAVRGFQAEKE